MEGITVGRATEEQVNFVFTDKVLLDRIYKVNPNACLDYEANHYYAVQYKHFIMLFTVDYLQSGYCQIHIACHKEHIRAIRILGYAGMNWVLNEMVPAVNGIILVCPKAYPKMENFGIKMGFFKFAETDLSSSLIYVKSKRV